MSFYLTYEECKFKSGNPWGRPVSSFYLTYEECKLNHITALLAMIWARFYLTYEECKCGLAPEL